MLKKICFCMLFAFQFLLQAEVKTEAVKQPPLRIQGVRAVSLKIEPGKKLETTGSAKYRKAKKSSVIDLE